MAQNGLSQQSCGGNSMKPSIAHGARPGCAGCACASRRSQIRACSQPKRVAPTQADEKVACHSQHPRIPVGTICSSCILLQICAFLLQNFRTCRIADGCIHACRFAFPDPNQESGLNVASCLLTRAPIGSENKDGTRKFVIR